MKKILYLFTIIAALFFTVSCEKDPIWGDGLAEMEHVYYIGFYKTNVNTDALNYEIAADGSARWRINTGTWINTAEANTTGLIPFQFHSERVRSYDAVHYFWITSVGTSSPALTPGIDYIVLDEQGLEIVPNSQGNYSMTWPQAKKGISNMKIKRLSAIKGSLKVNVLDPSKGTPNASDITTTVNNHTSDYEIRGLTFDYNKVTIGFN